MISEPYTYINPLGETVETVLEYCEVDNFDHLELVKCRQVRAVTYDPDLAICFVQHSGGREWGHPGGTIEKNGETPLEALERELVEETNTKLIKAIPIGYQTVVHPNGEKPDFYQLRYVAFVSKIGDFIADPAEPNLVCKEVSFEDVPQYIQWGEIGDRIYEQAQKIIRPA